jgi:hypothetical protein
MGEVTLKVPAEYVEDLRLATAVELGQDADWVKSASGELVRRSTPWEAADLADVDASARSLAQGVEVLGQLCDAGIWRSRAIRGEPSSLAHILETLADKILSPRLNSETITTPYDAEAVEKVRELTAELGWAVGESARLHELDRVERKVAKAEAG